MDVHGSCQARFEPVRQAFARNFEELGEVGAAVAVHVDGIPVVDLWAGLADAAAERPWQKDTLALVFSTTKGWAAVCALLLWERGQLDIDAPVADVWPEFAAAGKESMTTRHLLTHQAGLPAFDDPITVAECHDLDLVTSRLAAQAPRWDAGTAHGYHAITYGWLVGEVVRRVTGRTIGRFFAEEVAGPLGLDTYIGLPERLNPRVATLLPIDINRLPRSLLQDPKTQAIAAKIFDPESLTFRVFTNPPVLAGVDEFNSPAMYAAEWPAANGITTAGSLAKLYGELACDRVLSTATLDAAETAQVDGPDRVLVLQTRFGLGFALPSEVVDYGPMSSGFGHDGAGGSVGFADRRARMGFGYVMNQMGVSLGTDERVHNLTRALYTALGEG
ncbi:MAG: beta-lactamase family protein [Acidimicrobiia bacterium]|nr:beta-lactamase family protein [Acidimicrobiia bacterium]